MAARPWSAGSVALAGLVSALVVLSGCTDVGPAPFDPHPIGGDAGNPRDGATFCGAPTEGCACEPGTESIDCYLDPITIEDQITCRAGTRYCRDGAWTACESIVDYTLGGVGEALLSGPTPCNPCDPRCFGYVDRPGPTDITPGNSSNISYDTGRGGISLTPSMPVTPPLTDSDGDGIPDVADSCVGPGAFVDASGGCYGDTFFYHMLPYGSPAVFDPLNISVQIRTADVYFLMDTTGSMGGELARLRTDLTTGSFIAGCGNGVVGAIRCAIPDAWFGVGYFDDYPVSPYGGSGDDVFGHVLDITSSLSATQTAINTLGIHWGNDGPEGNTQALWAIATGGSLGPYLSSRGACSGSRWGYPCFRDGTIPIVIHITDAPFHNGPSNAYPYSLSWGSGATNVTGNENFASARAVGAITGWREFTGTTASMANDYSNPGCGSTTSRDALYEFTVTGTQTVTMTTRGAGYDTVLTLYRAMPPTTTAVSGNENFGSARVMAAVTGSDQTFTGSTAGMANDVNSGCGSSTAPDAFFRFTLPSTTTVTFDTEGSGYDTLLGLYNNSMALITCDDDSGSGTLSRISTTLAAGTYYIVVEGYSSNSGNYVLNFTSGLTTVASYLTCNNDETGYTSSLLTQTLTAGTYYVGVEGNGTSSGSYRLGLGTAAPTTPAPTSAVTWSETVAALSARDIRVITLQTCGSWGNSYCLEGESHAQSLAYATNSVNGSGSPYVFRGNADGSGLSAAIVNAVVGLANYTRMNISARAVGDVNGFTVLPITAVSWGPGNCTGISGGTTFMQCTPGTSVRFNVSFRNTSVMPTTVAQVFDFFIEVIGDGTIILERVPVRIVVPPAVPAYPPSGTYTRDYDATMRCAINERPVWGDLRWTVPDLPSGTSVRFELRTADTAAALPTATPLATVNVPSAGSGSRNVTTTLAGVGARTRLYFLRVHAVLNSSADRLRAPVLSEVQVAYTCIPDE